MELEKPAHLRVDAEAIAELLRAPKLDLHVRRLAGDYSRTKEVWKTTFSEHHYLTDGLPSALYPLIVRTANGVPVAFHGSSILPGGFNGGIKDSANAAVVQHD